MRGRHPNVDDGKLRLVLSDELEELVRIAGLTHDLEVGPLEQARQPFAQKDVVVGHDDATTGGRLSFHGRPTLRRCLVAGTKKSPPSGCKEERWSAFGAKPFSAIFVA